MSLSTLPTSSSSTAAVRRYTTATAYLRDHYALENIVPTSTPSVDESELPTLLAQDTHAVSSSTFFPPSTNGFVLSRVIEDAHTLELQWVSFSKGSNAVPGADADSKLFAELDEEQATLPPVRFVFPSRLVPNPSFIISATEGDTRELHVYALTEAGYLYVLRFAEPRLFYSLPEEDDEWCEEHTVPSLEARTPIMMHGVAEGRVTVACSDGFAVALGLADGTDSLMETELRSNSSFSVRSLIPSFSTRSLSSPSALRQGQPSVSSSQIISLASSTSEAASFAFAVSRDRKLRIWSLETGLCLKVIDLPKPASSSSTLVLSALSMDVDGTDSPSVPRPPKAGMLLPPTPQHFVKLIAGSTTSPYPSYLVIFSPATSTSLPAFFVYGIATDENSGALSELTPVGEKLCDSNTNSAALVDFVVEPFGLSAADADGWALWAAWEDAGECEIQCIALPEMEGVAAVEGDEWTVVERGTTAETARWTTGYFDELLEGNPKSIAEVFAEHVGHPGRYSPATLNHALSTYEAALHAELDGIDELPDALHEFYDTELERICAVVGSHVRLEQSPQTGAYLHEAFDKRLKMEWLRFVAMLNESRAAALFPTLLAVDADRRVAFVVCREAITTPIVQDTALALQRISRLPEDNDEPRIFLNLSPESLEPTYPHLAQRGFRSDILTIVSAIDQLERSLSASAARNLEFDLISRVRAPFTQSVETLAIDIYETSLEPHLDDGVASALDDQLRGLLSPEGSFQTLWAMLTTSELIHPLRDESEPSSPISDLTSALLVDALATSIETRYQLVKGLAALLLFVSGEESTLVPELNSLVSGTFASLHSLASLRWLAQQSAAPPIDAVSNDADMLERFGDMRVSAGGRGSDDGDLPPPPSFSLLDGLLRSRYSPPLHTQLPSPQALTHAMCAFIAATGIVSQKRIVVDSPADVDFALRLRQLRLPALATEFINFYPKGAGMLYVRGLASLDLGLVEEAQADFARAAPGLYDKETRFDEDSGISRVLPYDVAGSLGRYYRHVVALFVDDGEAAEAVVRFAQLAIEALAEEAVQEPAMEKDLWLKLFRSNAALGHYEEAYTTLMSIPFEDTKNACLAHLISVMCENGQVEALTRYSFAGMEADLERNLAFRARNSDPLATPNYYKILYTYNISKDDYRSAATIMFQQARRISDIHTRHASFSELATLQCQSYLAAVNALSLVAKEHAWLAVISAEDGSDRAKKRRKIEYQIPDEEFESTATRAPEVVDLVDIRREYTVALARLQLSEDFPELERTNLSLDHESVVALFSQLSRFEEGFTAARTLDVDLSSVFETLAEKCVGLSLHPDAVDNSNWVALSEEALTWEGSLASRAWRLLERHLERHDTDGTFRYRLVVLERTLATNRGGRLPTFLTEFFLLNDPNALIRTLVKYDRLSDAFQYSLSTVKSAPTGTGLASSSLPYSMFDQLLSLTAGDSPALSAEGLKARQSELRGAIASRTSALEKAGAAAMRAGR